jgi:thiol:disulfide interchange protein DsbD
MMGVLSTLIASPCITPPLLSVLTYIGDTGNALLGGLILFSLALGMGLPLILFGLGQGSLLPKAGIWMNKIKFLFGVMTLGLAIWMLSRLLSEEITLLLFATLLIISAVAFGALDFKAKKRLPPVLHGISFLALVYGSILLIGATNGNNNLLNPSKPVLTHSQINQPLPPAALFSTVKDLAELQQKLKTAKEAQKPVMIEFFASWCPACRALDRDVFSDANMQQRMNSFEKLRVDLTEKSDGGMQLVLHYNIYGTPTLIFYDKNGEQFETDAFNNGIKKESLTRVLEKLT